MILVFKGDNSKWHLVKSFEKSGLASITIKAYCGVEGNSGLRQVPDDFMTRLCRSCVKGVESL
jgi:hypothetical protein